MAMAKICYNKIKRDPNFTIDDVPAYWKAQVQALLNADNQ